MTDIHKDIQNESVALYDYLLNFIKPGSPLDQIFEEIKRSFYVLYTPRKDC